LAFIHALGRNFDSVSSPSWNYDDFWGLRVKFDFQQHSQKNQRAISVSFPETNLQNRTAAESFFGRKSSIQFNFIMSQPRIQKQAGIQDLLPNLNFCCLENMHPETNMECTNAEPKLQIGDRLPR
jgi:hypothetical protein